jgi:putative membrane protein insertion efficiency factor
MKILHSIYKGLFSKTLPLLFGGGCRYSPTCSDYARESIDRFGIIKGTLLSIKRLARCHPFSQASYFDPVPKD